MKLYDNPELEGEPIKKIAIRSKLHAYELDGDALYVEVTEKTISAYGMKGYISVDDFTLERPETSGYYQGPSGSSGGGSSSGGSSGGSVPEWSPDFL